MRSSPVHQYLLVELMGHTLGKRLAFYKTPRQLCNEAAGQSTGVGHWRGPSLTMRTPASSPLARGPQLGHPTGTLRRPPVPLTVILLLARGAQDPLGWDGTL